MTTTNSHAAPWTLRRFLAQFAPATPRRRSPRPGMDHVLSGREAVARHLYGEAVHWGSLDMAEYDNDARLRGAWLAEADRRIAHAGSPDRFVAAHHGITPADWDRLPSLAKVDYRESYYAAKWGRS